MKTSQLIKFLKKQQENYGDLEVVIQHRDCDGHYDSYTSELEIKIADVSYKKLAYDEDKELWYRKDEKGICLIF